MVDYSINYDITWPIAVIESHKSNRIRSIDVRGKNYSIIFVSKESDKNLVLSCIQFYNNVKYQVVGCFQVAKFS